MQSRNLDSAAEEERNPDSAAGRSGIWIPLEKRYNLGVMSFSMSAVKAQIALAGLSVTIVNSEEEEVKPAGIGKIHVRIRRGAEEIAPSETSNLIRQQITAPLRVIYALSTTKAATNDADLLSLRQKVRKQLVGWDAAGALADDFVLSSSSPAEEEANGVNGWIEIYTGVYWLEDL